MDVSKVVASPEMKFARNRLGDLLQGIRHNTTIPSEEPTDKSPETSDSEEDEGEPVEEDPLPSFMGSVGGSSPPKRSLSFSEKKSSPIKKLKKEKKVLFELRGKPFELRDRQKEESLFSLCRTWVKGKEETDIKAESPMPLPLPTDDSVDLLATKEIFALPKPKPVNPELAKCPEASPMDHPLDTLDLTNRQDILASYLPHWKDVKKRWIKRCSEKESRYTRSFSLLETVYNIAQQNQMIS